MATIVTRNFDHPEPASRDVSVKQKRVRDEDGSARTVWTIDAGSKTLGRDIGYVFGKNVAAARRANKAVTGAADRAPSRS